MAEKTYRPEQKHPEPYQHDLNPDASKGLNYGLEGASLPTRTAEDVKPVHNQLREFNDDELRQIRVLQPGSRLETDAVYLRLEGDHSAVYRAMGDEEVGPDDLYLPKKDMPYQLWNRLVGKF
jgi:hypothetical protein